MDWSSVRADREKIFRYANPSFADAPNVRGILANVWYAKFTDAPYYFLQSTASFECWWYYTQPQGDQKAVPLRYVAKGTTKTGVDFEDTFDFVDFYAGGTPPASIFMPPCFCVPDQVDRCVVDDKQVHHGIYQIVQEGVNGGLVAAICIILFLIGVIVGG